MFGALKETGLLLDLFNWLAQNISNLYVLNGAFTVIAAFLGNIPTLIAGVSIFNQSDAAVLPDVVRAESDFWPLLSYVTALGGSLLSTGTLAGILLMRMEGVSFGWYFRHITPKIFVGFFSRNSCVCCTVNLDVKNFLIKIITRNISIFKKVRIWVKFRCVGILTSGGDAPGMNAAIRAVTRSGICNGYKLRVFIAALMDS